MCLLLMVILFLIYISFLLDWKNKVSIALLKAARAFPLFCSRLINRPIHLNSSAKVASFLKMPQTNKFKCAAASSPAQSAGPDRGEPLRDPNAPPGDSGGDDNPGDPQIIKSPSDPKQYR